MHNIPIYATSRVCSPQRRPRLKLSIDPLTIAYSLWRLICLMITELVDNNRYRTRLLDANRYAEDRHSVLGIPCVFHATHGQINLYRLWYIGNTRFNRHENYANTQAISLTHNSRYYCDVREPSSVQWVERARCVSHTLPVATHHDDQYTMNRPFDTCQLHCDSSTTGRKCTGPFKRILDSCHEAALCW